MIKIDETEEECLPCTKDGGSRIVTTIKINDTFNDRLKDIIGNTNTNFEPLEVGCPSSKLLSTGLPNMPIQVSYNTLMKKKAQTNHPYKLSDVVHLPDYLSNPIAVFRSATSVEDVKIVLTELEGGGINMVVAIEPNYNGMSINSIRSIYPKENIKAIFSWIVYDNLLEYADKEKLLNWIDKHQSNPGDVTYLIKEATKIIQNSNFDILSN